MVKNEELLKNIKYLFIILILFFTACSTKEYKHIEPKIFILKTTKLKFADLAYLRHSGDTIELELFVAGKAMKRIYINNLLCIDEGCMRKSSFNKEYLYKEYPVELFEHVILGKKIYKGINLVYLNGGFEQKIESKDVAIMYRVDTKGVYFRDRKNNILIKLKDVKQ